VLEVVPEVEVGFPLKLVFPLLLLYEFMLIEADIELEDTLEA